MEVKDIKDVADVAGTVIKLGSGFWDILERIVPGIKIGRAITDGQVKIIENVLDNENIDIETKRIFLATYKKQYKELKRCAKVSEEALEKINKDSDASKVTEDWYDFFFDKVRIISDERIQSIWAQILAGEINTQGSFSKSLIHNLSIMTSKQANDFCNISRFCIKEYRSHKQTKHVHAFIFIKDNPKLYESSGVTYEGLKDLESLGLVRCDFERGYVFWNKQYLQYGTNYIEIRGNIDNEDKIYVGNVCLTENGESLYEIVGDEYKAYSSQILDYTISELELRGCQVYVNEQLKTKR